MGSIQHIDQFSIIPIMVNMIIIFYTNATLS